MNLEEVSRKVPSTRPHLCLSLLVRSECWLCLCTGFDLPPQFRLQSQAATAQLQLKQQRSSSFYGTHLYHRRATLPSGYSLSGWGIAHIASSAPPPLLRRDGSAAEAAGGTRVVDRRTAAQAARTTCPLPIALKKSSASVAPALLLVAAVLLFFWEA